MQDIKLVRNVAIFGHGKSGKTSLAEALLFTAGKTSRLGSVDNGTSVMDFEPEEINRKLSIGSSFNRYSWKKHEVNLIDTPGDDNFLNDAMLAAKVADSAIFVVGAVLGVKYQTTKIASFVLDNKLPTIIFINKMDRERADFAKTLAGIQSDLSFKPAVLQVPIGAEADFKGLVDVVNQKAYMFEDKDGGKVKEGEIPAGMADEISGYRENLMEMVAETDDELIEQFLENGELSEDELRNGLVNGIKSGAVCPVCIGAATANLGTELLLNMINDLLPSPMERPARLGTDPKSKDTIERKPLPDEPFSGLVFKTMADPYAGRLTIFKVFSGTLDGDTFYNSSKEISEKVGQLLVLEGKENKVVESLGPGMVGAVAKLKETVTGDSLCAENAPILYERPAFAQPTLSYAVKTTKKEDEDKLFSSIAKILEEDPALKLTREPQTHEILICGIAQTHLQVTGEKIKRKFGVEMDLHLPKVPYKETIKGKARVQGKHKKQSGGRGQFADSWIEIEPLERGGGFVFEDKIVGGAIPRQYIPAVEKGVVEAMEGGILAGYPMVDVKVALVDGSFHTVDSSEMAFKISGSIAIKKGVLEAKPVLLEPIMTVQVRVPKDLVGDVMGDMNSRRGKVMGMDSEKNNEVITAQVPMAEILEYTSDLTSITGGRGYFSMEFSHYEEVPSQLAAKIIEDANKANEG